MAGRIQPLATGWPGRHYRHSACCGSAAQVPVDVPQALWRQWCGPVAVKEAETWLGAEVAVWKVEVAVSRVLMAVRLGVVSTSVLGCEEA